MSESFAILCCALVFFDSTSQSLRNLSIIVNEQDYSIGKDELHHVNSTKNDDNKTNLKDDDSMQYEFFAHVVIKYSEEDTEIPGEFEANFTVVDKKNKSKNNNNNENDNNNSIVPYEMCDNITCIRLCCPLGNRLVDKNCTAGGDEYIFPNVYEYSNDSLQSKNKTMDKLVDFQLTVENPCRESKEFMLNPNDTDKHYKYMFFANGSLYLSHFDKFVESTSYCLAVVNHNQFDAFICMETYQTILREVNSSNSDEIESIENEFGFSCRIVSLVFQLITFLVYSMPELCNIHSFMLCRYSGSLFIATILCLIDDLFIMRNYEYSICVIMALIEYFCYLACFFWLTVMSFDMWKTFRELLSLQISEKQQRQKRKKLIYSIFAWSGPFIFTIICVIIEFVPGLSDNLILPEFGVDFCWFKDGPAYWLYYYLPKTICIVSSVCLSIYTAVKIARYEKDVAHNLGDSESRRYNNSKKWFNLYLQLFITLFIVMTIDWIILTAGQFFSLSNNILIYVLFFNYFTKTIQDICAFIIFVCKKTIMRVLLKRFCHIQPIMIVTATTVQYHNN